MGSHQRLDMCLRVDSGRFGPWLLNGPVFTVASAHRFLHRRQAPDRENRDVYVLVANQKGLETIRGGHVKFRNTVFVLVTTDGRGLTPAFFN